MPDDLNRFRQKADECRQQANLSTSKRGSGLQMNGRSGKAAERKSA
jgi:hypothetical protein